MALPFIDMRVTARREDMKTMQLGVTSISKRVTKVEQAVDLHTALLKRNMSMLAEVMQKLGCAREPGEAGAGSAPPAAGPGAASGAEGTGPTRVSRSVSAPSGPRSTQECHPHRSLESEAAGGALGASHIEDTAYGAVPCCERWDEDSESCSICHVLLGRRRLRLRHHCRICGRCVCGPCSPNMITVPGYSKDLQRACTPCLAIAAWRGSERHSQKQGSTSQDSGKELVSALKKPNRNSRSSRHSQTSLASASTPERPGRSSLRVSVPEINTLEPCLQFLRSVQAQVQEAHGCSLFAAVVTMARRGTTVGVGGLTLAAGQERLYIHEAHEGILPPQARGCLGRFVSNPSSPRRIAYELFGLLLIVYDMIWLPMQVFEPPEADFFFVMGLVSSLYWTFDMPTSFLVGYAGKQKTWSAGRLNELLEHVQSEFSVIVIGILKLKLGNDPTWGISEAKLNWLEHTSVINDNLAYKYFTSLHWSLTQFTPASMEVTPRNEIERLFNVVVIMSAMVIFSTFISAITNAMNQLRNLNSERNEQASLLRRYMQQNNVSPPLKARVLQSIKALSQTRSREVYAPHLAVHPFFYVCNVCFSMQSRKIQSTCLAEKSLSTSQELITSGENATHMYFVIGGILDYLADERGDNEARKRKKNGLVEAALWVKWQHNGTANTNHGCELISVDAGGLQSILKDEKPVRQYANMFWKHFSDNPDTLSDVWCEEEVLFDWATRAMGQAETYYGDVIPAEPATNTNTKFGQFLQAQRRASSGFVGRRFSDDSLTGLVPNDFPAVLAGEGGRLASQQEGSEASSSSSGFSTDSDDSKNSKND
eukprot:g10107.t1